MANYQIINGQIVDVDAEVPEGTVAGGQILQSNSGGSEIFLSANISAVSSSPAIKLDCHRFLAGAFAPTTDTSYAQLTASRSLTAQNLVNTQTSAADISVSRSLAITSSAESIGSAGLQILRKLSGNIFTSVYAPPAQFSVQRGLQALAQGNTISADVGLHVGRTIAAAMQASTTGGAVILQNNISLSSISAVASNTTPVHISVARTLAGAMEVNTYAPECLLRIIGDITLSAQMAPECQAGPFALAVSRSLSGIGDAQTHTANIRLTLPKILAGTIACNTLCAVPALSIQRPVIGHAVCVTSSNAGAGLSVRRPLDCNFDSHTQTAQGSLSVMRALTAQSGPAMSAAGIRLVVTRALACMVAAQSQVFPITLRLVGTLSAAMNALSHIPDVRLFLDTALGANMRGRFITKDAAVIVERLLGASTAPASAAKIIELIMMGMGPATNTQADMVTTLRTLERVSILRVIEKI